jgi:hypothetical protein
MGCRWTNWAFRGLGRQAERLNEPQKASKSSGFLEAEHFQRKRAGLLRMNGWCAIQNKTANSYVIEITITNAAAG